MLGHPWPEVLHSYLECYEMRPTRLEPLQRICEYQREIKHYELNYILSRPALEAEYRALEYTPSGRPVTWKGSQGNLYGEVTAAQPYRVGSQDCRQYTHTFSLNGPRQTVRGTACRNPDGSWTPLT